MKEKEERLSSNFQLLKQREDSSLPSLFLPFIIPNPNIHLRLCLASNRGRIGKRLKEKESESEQKGISTCHTPSPHLDSNIPSNIFSFGVI